jgi:hypothetical protein
MFKDNQFSSLRILKIKDKTIYIVDKHQYMLPLWGSLSIENDKSYVLVSIDYHPDTNPPFYQESLYDAIKKDDINAESLAKKIIIRKIEKIDRDNIENLVKISDRLSNDEHINTALSLNYLSDYHMINCMDKHKYEKGTHYKVSKEYFSLLEDKMFESINFSIPNQEFILDIDLDYFSKKNSFNPANNNIIKMLIKKSKIITIARSKKYFEYLKDDDFNINECENLIIEMIKKYK